MVISETAVLITGSEFFNRDELQCRCGRCGQRCEMDERFLERLDDLRRQFGGPLYLSSGFRCVDHDRAVSTSSNAGAGPHTSGKAVDILISRGKAYRLLELALGLKFTGIGVNQKGSGRFIHVDTISEGLRPTVWSY